MNDGARRRRKFVVKAGLSAAVLGAVVWWIGPQKLGPALAALTPAAFAATLAVFLCIHTAAAFKWRAFMSLAGAPLPPGMTLRAYGAGLFANLFLPSMIGGDVVRAGIAMQGARRKEAVVLGSLVDRLSDFAALALLALGGIAALPQAMADGGGSAELGRRILGWFAALCVGGVLALAIGLRLRPPSRWPTKARGLLLRSLLALRRAGRRKIAATTAVLVAVALQAALLLVNAELGRAMGLDATLPVWFVCWPLAKIAAMLPLSLAGLGVREAAFAALGSRFGIAPALATAVSLAWQGVLFSGGLVGGAGYAASRRTAESR